MNAMDTKERILVTALQLFNEQGTDQVTVRQIAAVIGISHGNLCYHFPNISAIVLQLQERFKASLGQFLLEYNAKTKTCTFEEMLHYTERAFRLAYEYRFLSLDFVQLIRRIPEIRAYYHQSIPQSHQYLREWLADMRMQGWLRDEPTPHFDEQYVQQLLISTKFWLVPGELLAKQDDAWIRSYAYAWVGQLVPYFSEQGLAEYCRCVPQNPDGTHVWG